MATSNARGKRVTSGVGLPLERRELDARSCSRPTGSTQRGRERDEIVGLGALLDLDLRAPPSRRRTDRRVRLPDVERRARGSGASARRSHARRPRPRPALFPLPRRLQGGRSLAQRRVHRVKSPAMPRLTRPGPQATHGVLPARRRPRVGAGVDRPASAARGPAVPRRDAARHPRLRQPGLRLRPRTSTSTSRHTSYASITSSGSCSRTCSASTTATSR